MSHINWFQSWVSFNFKSMRTTHLVSFHHNLYSTIVTKETQHPPWMRVWTRSTIVDVPTSCDKKQRATYISEDVVSEMVTTYSAVYWSYTGDSALITRYDLDTYIPENLDDKFWNRPPYDWPECKIPETQCSEAWAAFKEAMRQYIPEAEKIFNMTLEYPDPGAAKEMVEWRRIMKPKNGTIFGHIMIDEFISGNVNANLLGGCMEPRISLLGVCNNYYAMSKASIDTLGLAPEAILTKLGDESGCEVGADQGVLLYFPPEKAHSTRDLCANDGWGDDPLVSTANGPPKSTTVTAVTFSAHSFFRNHRDISDLWDSYPVWMTESVMTGHWPMTAGTAYLAINTLMVYYACNYRPMNMYKDILLTVPTADLSSIILNSFATSYPVPLTELITTRPFNLLDLDGPVPARAWQVTRSGSPFIITDGKYEPRILLPSTLKDYHPDFKSCIPFSINSRAVFFAIEEAGHVWDPPVILTGEDVQLTQAPMPEASTRNPVGPQMLPQISLVMSTSNPVVGPVSAAVPVQGRPAPVGNDRIEYNGLGLSGNVGQVGGSPVIADNSRIPLMPGYNPAPMGSTIVSFSGPKAASFSSSLNPAPTITAPSVEGLSVRAGSAADGKGGGIATSSIRINTIGSKDIGNGTSSVLSNGRQPSVTGGLRSTFDVNDDDNRGRVSSDPAAFENSNKPAGAGSTLAPQQALSIMLIAWVSCMYVMYS
jgi:hypothetical protein